MVDWDDRPMQGLELLPSNFSIHQDSSELEPFKCGNTLQCPAGELGDDMVYLPRDLVIGHGERCDKSP